MADVKRKCSECGKEMFINLNNINQVINFETKCYHHDCFTEMCKRKVKNSRALPKWGEALANLKAIQEQSNLRLKTDIYKNDIYEFILEHYDTVVVSNTIFQRLEDIYNGRWKGLSCGIPPEDLLYMWTHKINYLNKIKAKNITLGKVFNTEQQIKYDIAILIGQYNDYLKWKEKQKILEHDAINNTTSDNIIQIDLNKLSDIAQANNKQEEDDMDSLLDELFN